MDRSARLAALGTAVILCSCPGRMAGGPPRGDEPPVATGVAAAFPAGGDATAGGAPAAANELRVSSFGPQGDTEENAQIVVRFSAPMVPLGTAAGMRARDVLTLTPPVAGEQVWLSPATVAFVPAAPLPRAQTFVVEVPAGTADVSGAKKLARALSFSFNTPRPRLVSSSEGGEPLGPRQPFFLVWDAAVSIAAVTPAIAVTAAEPEPAAIAVTADSDDEEEGEEPEGGPRQPARPVPFELRKVTGDACPWNDEDATCVAVVPQRAWPAGARLEVTVSPGVVSDDGPLPSTERAVFTADVRDRMRLLGVVCAEVPCRPEEPITLVFSNPVADVRRAPRSVSLKPGRGAVQTHAYEDTIEITGMAPETTYRLEVAPGLRDVHGQELAARTILAFTTGRHRPHVGVATGAVVIDRRSPHALAASLEHVRGPRLRMRRVARDEVIPTLRWLSGRGRAEDAPPPADALAGSGLAPAPEVAPVLREEDGVPVEALVPLDREVAAGEAGFVYYELGGEELPPHAGVVQLTSLAVSARADGDAVAIWVTDLATAEPQPGIALELRDDTGKLLWSGAADAGGLARAPGARRLARGGKSPTLPLHVLAARGDDVAILELPSRDHGEPEPRALVGAVFADRSLYRPGDVVRFKGYARLDRPDGVELPTGDAARLQVTLQAVSGPTIASTEITVGPRGSFDGKLAIPAAARLGWASLSVQPVADDLDGRFSARLRLGEFRIPELEIAVTAGVAEGIRGDPVPVRVRASYLHGHPARNLPAMLSTRADATTYEPPGWEEYSFVPEELPVEPGGWKESAITLDGSGGAEATLPTGRSQGVPVKFLIDAEATDLTRQSVAARTEVLLHPAELYLGARIAPNGREWQAVGDELRVEVIAVTAAGKPYEGELRDVAIVVTGPPPPKGKRGKPMVVRCEAVDRSRPPVIAVCAARPDRPGKWEAQAVAGDGRGNALRVDLDGWVSEEPAPAKGTPKPPPPPRPDFELAPDQPAYAPGATAQVEIRNSGPFARGLVSVERGALREVRAVELGGAAPPAPLRVPLAERDLPELEVVLHAVTARRTFDLDADGWDAGRPAQRTISAPLPIDVEAERLRVEVVPARAEARPGDEVEVEVRVTDPAGSGVAAEVTLWAVDEGVLLLERHELPDFVETVFRAGRGGDVAGADLRRDLAVKLGFSRPGPEGRGYGYGSGRGSASPRVSMGSATAAGGERIRRAFDVTPYFNPSIVTAGDGKARVRVRMPDGLTRYRFRAVAAVGLARFGAGEATVSLSEQLMLRPALPRFLVVGDHAEGGVVVGNATAAPLEVAVSAEARGVALGGATEARLTLAAGESREVAFAFTAEAPGAAVLTFRARAGQLADAVEVTLPIRRPLVTESTAVYGVLEEEALAVPLALHDVRPDVGGLELGLATTALAGLEDGARYLIEYPYGCVEQTTSRLYPIIALGELGPELTGLPRAELRALAEAGLARLRSLQRSDGGFATWPGGRKADPFGSLYATLGLLDAQRAGLPVEPDVLSPAKSYVHELAEPAPADGKPAPLELRAFAVYVLASAGELDDETHAAVLDLAPRRGELPLFARLWLFFAFDRVVRAGAAGPDGETVRAQMLTELGNLAHETARGAHFREPGGRALAGYLHSEHRTDAIALSVLLEAAPDHPLIDKLAAGLMEARAHGRWDTTQENAWAIRALGAYHRAREAVTPDLTVEAWLGTSRVFRQELRGASSRRVEGEVPMAQVLAAGPAGQVILARQGVGRLYYRLAATYAPVDQRPPPFDAGLRVRRRYYTLDGQELTGDPLLLTAGSVVLVEVTVETDEERFFVAIDDPLPAGVEAVDPANRTTSRAAASRHGAWEFDYLERRDDRVTAFADRLEPGRYGLVYLVRVTTPGAFRAGPTVAQEMYSPEVFGRGAGMDVRITR